MLLDGSGQFRIVAFLDGSGSFNTALDGFVWCWMVLACSKRFW